MILYDPRAANAPSPRMRRAKTPFARCPCTKPAICAGAGAGAVNHPHHINCMNHSSNKCQPALIHALTPVNPSIRRQRAPARPVLARRDHAGALRQPPVCRHAPKTFLPNLSQTLVNSRPSLVRALIPVQPLHPPQKSLQRDLCPARDARGLRQPPRQPCCAQNFLPNLTQSLVISRRTLIHLACLSTLSTAPKMLLTSIPFETGTLPANQTTLSWPSRLPLPNPQYAIQRPTCSFPLARACTTV